jgi:amidase
MFKSKSLIPASLGALAALGTATSGCGALGGPEFTFKPEEATIKDVRNLVKTNVVSCRQMMSKYQLLHDELDPNLKSITTWNDKLMQDADRLDRMPQGQRGSFHCVPIVVKDNVNVAGLPTTGGASVLGSDITGNNAPVVDKLLTAGAIVLGKSNMPDFATDGMNTLSSFGGQTPNPYNHTLTVYGSSGGTAAAISSSLGIVGVGTDTYGSLVQPGSAAGIVAIRPTQGLLPGVGILPLMSLQDMAGPMTRTVEDAAATLELMVDKAQASKGSQSYTTVLDARGLAGLRIGFDPAVLQNSPAPMMIPSPEVQELWSATLASLRQAGATTKQVDALMPLFPSLSAAINSSFACMPVDFKESLNGYLSSTRPEAAVKNLSDIISTRQYLPSVRSFLDSAQSQTDSITSSAACQQYIADRAAASTAVTQLLDREGLDLFIYPAANQPPFTIGPPPAGWFGFQALSSNTGLPSLTMPMGVAPKSGAPVGLVFLARSHQEAKLVQAAFSLQSSSKPRPIPTNVTP